MGDSLTIFGTDYTEVTIAANQEVAVYVRSRGSGYYACCGTLVIIQTT